MELTLEEIKSRNWREWAHTVRSWGPKFEPHRPPKFPPMLAHYVGERLGGRARRDSDSHRSISIWTAAVRNVRLDNAADIRTLAWAADVCDEENDPQSAESARGHLRRYLGVLDESPIEHDALNVQIMDCIERDRESYKSKSVGV